MKFASVVAFVAVAHAMEGEDEMKEDYPTVAYGDACDDATPCADSTLTCATTKDGLSGYCQDCTMESRSWDDGEWFMCPGDEMKGEDDSSSSLVASAAAFIAAATMMA